MMMMKVLITMMAMISVSMAAKQKLHNEAEIKPVADVDVKFTDNPVLNP
ncbi:hypothetical protein MP638_002614 [Amoeboaphelidium occidentale]|nr:hypothetical protein MP638_002614 [Amoeboaphelidium occidentale]